MTSSTYADSTPNRHPFRTLKQSQNSTSTIPHLLHLLGSHLLQHETKLNYVVPSLLDQVMYGVLVMSVMKSIERGSDVYRGRGADDGSGMYQQQQYNSSTRRNLSGVSSSSLRDDTNMSHKLWNALKTPWNRIRNWTTTASQQHDTSGGDATSPNHDDSELSTEEATGREQSHHSSSTASSPPHHHRRDTTSLALRARLQKDLFRYVHHEELNTSQSLRYRKLQSLLRISFLIGRMDRFRERYLDGILWVFYHVCTEYLFAQSLGEFIWFSLLRGLFLGPAAFVSKSRARKSFLKNASGKRVKTQKAGGSYAHQRKTKLLMKFAESVMVQWMLNFFYEMGLLKSLARLVVRSKSNVERLLGVSESSSSIAESREALARREFQFESDSSYMERQREWLDSFMTFMGREMMLAQREIEDLDRMQASEREVGGSFQKSSAPYKSGSLPLSKEASAPPRETTSYVSSENSQGAKQQNAATNQYSSVPDASPASPRPAPPSDSHPDSHSSAQVFNYAMHTLLKVQSWSESNSNRKHAHSMDLLMNDLQHFQSLVHERNLSELQSFCKHLRQKYTNGRFQLPSLGLFSWWNPSTMFISVFMGKSRYLIRFVLRLVLSILMFHTVHQRLFRWLYAVK